MTLQIIFAGVLFLLGAYSLGKIIFTESEVHKVFYSLLLFVVVCFLTMTTVVLAIQLNDARKGCDEYEIIQQPIYRKK